MSRRIELSRALCRLWSNLGRYHVNRGPIHWPSFHFGVCPSPDGIARAVAIGFDEATIFGRESGVAAGDEVILSFDVGREIDHDKLDQGLDEAVSDAREVLQQLRVVVAEDGDPLLIGSNMDSATAAEWVSHEHKICGVRIGVRVTF